MARSPQRGTNYTAARGERQQHPFLYEAIQSIKEYGKNVRVALDYIPEIFGDIIKEWPSSSIRKQRWPGWTNM